MIKILSEWNDIMHERVLFNRLRSIHHYKQLIVGIFLMGAVLLVFIFETLYHHQPLAVRDLDYIRGTFARLQSQDRGSLHSYYLWLQGDPVKFQISGDFFASFDEKAFTENVHPGDPITIVVASDLVMDHRQANCYLVFGVMKGEQVFLAVDQALRRYNSKTPTYIFLLAVIVYLGYLLKSFMDKKKSLKD